MKFLNRLWLRRQQPNTIVTVQRPIPFSERQPGPDDLGGFDNNCCWWGHWQYDHWSWTWDYEPVRDETHWLPASVELLPVRCYPPEAKP